jgi:hypothetical protein
MRAWLARLGRLLLDYTPPPGPGPQPFRPEGPPHRRLRWLAAGGGLGALTAYGPGLAMGVALVLWVVWSRFLFTTGQQGGGGPPLNPATAIGALAYFALAGFLTSRRTGSIQAGAVVGAVTALVGTGIGLVALAIVDAAVLLLPLLAIVMLPVTAYGFVAGAGGAALGQPRRALRAILNGIRES